MRTVEEIRKSTDRSQIEFAKDIGLSTRSYTNKIHNRQEWKLSEIVKVAELNEGEVQVEINGVNYDITMKKA